MALWLQMGDPSLVRLALVAAALICVDAAMTTFNDISDRDTDQMSSESDRRSRPLLTGAITPRGAYLQVAALASAGLALAFVGTLWFGLLLTAGVLYCLAYSGKPVAISRRPFISQLFWVVLWPAIYFAVYLVVGGDLLRGWPYVLGTMIFMGVAEILAKDLRDLENDRAVDKRTTPVVIGVRSTARASFAGFIAGSLIYVIAPLVVEPASPRLAVALAIVLIVWCARAWQLTRDLGRVYSNPKAKELQIGAIRAFITVNALFIAGLFS